MIKHDVYVKSVCKTNVFDSDNLTYFLTLQDSIKLNVKKIKI
jgi:hypothetical protein